MSTHSGFQDKILFLLVIAIVFLASFFKIADLDFWWHLKTGQIILQEKEFQHREIYSFTSAGNRYIDHEWGFQILLYLAYSAAGPAGVILLKCAILIATYLLIARYLRQRNVSRTIVLAVILLSVCGGRTRFIERPEILTEFFLVVIYLLIDSFLRTGKNSRLISVLAVVLVWSNIHAAVILGLLLQTIFIAGLKSGTIHSMDILNIHALILISFHHSPCDLLSFIRRIIQHLYFKAVARIIDMTDGINQPFHNIHLVKNRKLNGHNRQLLKFCSDLRIAASIFPKKMNHDIAVNPVNGKENQYNEVKNYNHQVKQITAHMHLLTDPFGLCYTCRFLLFFSTSRHFHDSTKSKGSVWTFARKHFTCLRGFGDVTTL